MENSNNNNVINVSIIGLGTAAQTVTVTQGETVEIALAKAVLDSAGMDIRVNGEVATPATPIEEEAVVTAMPHVEGGLAA
jgi:hypothetical protein